MVFYFKENSECLEKVSKITLFYMSLITQVALFLTSQDLFFFFPPLK